MKKTIAIICLAPLVGWSQIGGQFGYQSLNHTSNPRAAALGGTTISLADGDISQFFENPATLDSVQNNNLFLQFNPYLADIIAYTGAYSFKIGKIGVFAAGINYINYGSFEATDETGTNLGNFSAQDYTITIGKAHQLGIFTLGTNLKLAHITIENYSSTAILMDIGGIFRVNNNWVVSMVFENIGGRLSNFTNFNTPKLPFDIKLGTTFKLEHMPLRFTFTTTNLVNQNADNVETISGQSDNTIDKILKRVNVGAEVLLSKQVQLLVGYSHERKKALRIQDKSSGSGLSFGVMIKVKHMEFRFAHTIVHVVGGANFISFRTNFNDFKKIL